jgi:transposase
VLLDQPIRKGVGYFGVARVRDGRFVYHRETDGFNAQTFWAFMKRLHQGSGRTGRRVVVITDNAKYHHAALHRPWREAHADRFAMDYFPPYSPDPNAIERAWKLTRRRATHNRYVPALNDVVAAVEGEFDLWARGNNTLGRLCALILRRRVQRAAHAMLSGLIRRETGCLSRSGNVGPYNRACIRERRPTRHPC